MHQPEAGESSDDHHPSVCAIDDRMLVGCARIEAGPALQDGRASYLDPEAADYFRQDCSDPLLVCIVVERPRIDGLVLAQEASDLSSSGPLPTDVHLAMRTDQPG